MSQKIRKQVYLEKRQQTLLKRLARAQGVSEAEVIREAIDRHAPSLGRQTPDPAAWAQARQFMHSLEAKGPLAGHPRPWRRDDIDEERAGRMDSRAIGTERQT